MHWLLTTVITGAVTFAATNVDDIFVLMLFFSQVNSRLRPRHIVAGQYLGFTALVAISLLGFLGGLLVPRAWVGLLGLAPIAIGMKKLLRMEVEREGGEEASGSSAKGVVSVAAVTFANGGDNIGIYTPLFANSGPARLAAMLGVFYLLLGTWCYAGYVITRHPVVARVLARYGHLAVPFVLIGLGIYILIESGTFGLLGL